MVKSGGDFIFDNFLQTNSSSNSKAKPRSPTSAFPATLKPTSRRPLKLLVRQIGDCKRRPKVNLVRQPPSANVAAGNDGPFLSPLLFFVSFQGYIKTSRSEGLPDRTVDHFLSHGSKAATKMATDSFLFLFLRSFSSLSPSSLSLAYRKEKRTTNKRVSHKKS